jgi:hypothetical protein
MESLKIKFIRLLMALPVFILTTVSTQAAEETFSVIIGSNNSFDSGDGSGYNDGTWYQYFDNEWWNQWFENDSCDSQHKAVIDLSLTVKLKAGANQGSVNIAYNWSTPEWSNKGEDHPPLPGDVPNESAENQYIKRNKFFSGSLQRFSFTWGGFSSGSSTIRINNHYEITDYNPEWISIDVQGSNFEITSGSIKHECVPKNGAPPQQKGKISGIKWNDINGDGDKDADEPGLANWKIYLVNTPNGQWDSGEPYQMTDAGGNYKFTNLEAGTYTVAEVLQSDWEQTYPIGGGGTYTVTIGPGEAMPDINFGNRLLLTGELDFGDAPDGPYPTLLAHDGARHKIVPSGPWLGAAGDYPDAEADGQPDYAARGDDNRGRDDEQGVWGFRLPRGRFVTVYVDVSSGGSGGGYVDAWIDFNRDGDWYDSNEHVHSKWLPKGRNSILIKAPYNSSIGSTFGRFRISSQGGLAPTGLANDGEVEDHSFWISFW